MNVTWKDDEVARARRRQLQLEAEAERLTHSLPRVRQSRGVMLRGLAAISLRLGDWMVATGCQLQSRAAQALPHRPIVARLDLGDSPSSVVTITRGC